MSKKSEPWYLHTILYVIVIILAYLLIQVAIVEPRTVIEQENYFRTESRLRMTNIKEAEILWQRKYEQYTDNLDGLISFIKNDKSVREVMSGYDSLTQKSTNPFSVLSDGEFNPDSLARTPRSHHYYTLKVDTLIEVDTVINRFGKVVKIDSNTITGQRYFLECPDQYGSIGDLIEDAKKNSPSWE